MDKLPPLGTAIADTAPHTIGIYQPLVSANKANIKSTPCKTSSYGPHPRQELDVYTPSKSTAANGPILLFLYGGGLIRGAKILPGPDGLIHANVGHFFAETFGFTTVIADYRLISHGAAFPSGGEDIALAVDWIGANLLSSGQQRDLFIMGNSAGGVHLSQYLFSSELQDRRATVLSETSQLRFRGAVMLSVPFHFRKAIPARAEVLQTFFGTPEQIEQRCPLGLLESLAQRDPGQLGKYSILVLNGELDPEDEIFVAKEDFVAALGKVVGANYTVQMMAGHNHISPPLALGTGIEREEAWGLQVGRWVNFVLSSV